MIRRYSYRRYSEGRAAHWLLLLAADRVDAVESTLGSRPYVDGAYVNVPNIGMAEWETAYWGRSFNRLRKIKAKYDPHNVFQYEQSIPPATL